MTALRSYAWVSIWPGILVCLAGLVTVSNPDYDTPSKKEFDAFLKHQGNAAAYQDFLHFLDDHRVLDVVPPDQLLRQGTDWRKLREPAFALPPKDQWNNIVPVLRLLREEVIPRVGPVEILSGFRTARYNRRAQGARTSKHLAFNAVDVIPLNTVPKAHLYEILPHAWETQGRRWNWGLGLYEGVRFHVDTGRYRRW